VVVGFYSLAVSSLDPQAYPSRVMQGLARHPVPVMILARLAVGKEHQRKSLGKILLEDALLRTARAADSVGIRSLLLYANDDVALRWYTSPEFESSLTDPYHLFPMQKDLKKVAGWILKFTSINSAIFVPLGRYWPVSLFTDTLDYQGALRVGSKPVASAPPVNQVIYLADTMGPL
jgi:hypothetical protein